MADWRALTGWLQTEAASPRVIAFGAGSVADEVALRARIAAWRAALRPWQGRRIGLYLDDPFDFAAALLAGWQAACRLVLPADLHADTLAAAAGQVDAWIGASVPGQPTLRPQEGAIADGMTAAGGSLCLFTSGSSGPAQAIDKRLDQLEAELVALENAFGDGLGAAQVQATVSHQHIYGLLFRVLWPLCAGRPFARERLLLPEQIVSALSAAPCLLVSTPAHLARLPEGLPWAAASRQLRAVFSSGGALAPAAAQTLAVRLGRLPIEVYGSTETGGIAWRRPEHEGSVWNPLPGVAWRIDQERLWIRSPFLAEATRWQPTEDRAEAAGDSFRLLGRADRIVKIEQRRVSLAALEQALLAEPGVQAVHLLALGGKRDSLGAVIVLADLPLPQGSDKRRAWIARLRQRLQAVTDPVCWPRQWRFVAELPVDARGKTPLARLRRLFEAELPAAVWSHQEADQARLECPLDPALEAFAGHFPEAAVLPGVALLDWVARWAQQAFVLAGAFGGMEQLKFQRLARPGMRLQVHLERQLDGGRVAFQVQSAAGQHASGRLLFGASG